MATQTMTHAAYEQMRAEHTEICELVTTLYRVLAERHEPAPRVLHLLESLLERTTGHFQDEESYGLFEDLVRRTPQRAATIRELRAEHAVLLARLKQLRQHVQGELGPDDWQQLEQGFREFANVLCHHETRENELLIDAYEQDLGDQD
jgi:iron-sulfur cluster repair protein YtfE (RIC family)